jgi:hypothetical protein
MPEDVDEEDEVFATRGQIDEIIRPLAEIVNTVPNSIAMRVIRGKIAGWIHNMQTLSVK